MSLYSITFSVVLFAYRLYLFCQIKQCNYSIYLNALAAAADILQISALDLAFSSSSLCIWTVALIPSMLCSCFSYRFFLFMAANATKEPSHYWCPLFAQNIFKEECFLVLLVHHLILLLNLTKNVSQHCFMPHLIPWLNLILTFA